MILQMGMGPTSVLLDEYPKQLVVSLCIRANWEREEKVGDATGCGEEGVWYRDPDFSPVIKLEPFRTGDHQRFYDIQLPSLARQHSLSQHRFLVKYWDMDVYLPALKTTRFSVVEYVDEEGKSYWELREIGITLTGFAFETGFWKRVNT
jgi:hypothetical protein